MVILGLLLTRDLTIYEIKKAFEQVINFFYSASFGSLHPALKKLESRGFIRVRRTEEGGRAKKVYSITEKGREELGLWLEKDIQTGRIQDEGLLKLFFITELPRRKRLKVLKNYTALIQEHIHALRALEAESRAREIPAALRETFNYRMLTADFGLNYYQFELNWYESVIQRIEKGEL